MKVLRLLCSECSNPTFPEFREWIQEGNHLKCSVCGRELLEIESEPGFYELIEVPRN